MTDILVTAGATRNPIDSMRYISANSSGRTGAWLARELSSVGTVMVLGSPEALCRCDPNLDVQEFSTTDDLMAKMQAWVQDHPAGIVIHAAAVGDYTAKTADQNVKLASGQDQIHLTLIPTPKILDAIRSWSNTAVIVSFKAAPPGTSKTALETIARSQANRSESAAVFANTIGRLDEDILFWTQEGSHWSEKRGDALAHLIQWIQAQCD